MSSLWQKRHLILLIPTLLPALVASWLAFVKQDDSAKFVSDYSSAAEVCSLLTKADLEIGLGRRFSDGTDLETYDDLISRAMGIPGGRSIPPFLSITAISRCMYVSRDGAGKTFALGVASAFADVIWTRYEQTARNPNRFTTLKGLGEKAIWDSETREMLLLAENKVIGLALPLERFDVNSKERASRLALRALARLRPLAVRNVNLKWPHRDHLKRPHPRQMVGQWG